MRGQITGFGYSQGEGYLKADDGNDYLFSLDGLPTKGRTGEGDWLDFDLVAGFPTNIRAVDQRIFIPWRGLGLSAVVLAALGLTYVGCSHAHS